MPRPLEVIITSGGTISKIDDVRHIGNFSKGTTGSLIAEEFLRKGAIVHYVYGSNAKQPFCYKPRPSKSIFAAAKEAINVFKAELMRVRYGSRLKEHPIKTFDNYLQAVKTLVTENNPDVIVLAAAVSDYGVKKADGKVSSELDSINIELLKNPKVISLIKKWNPHIFQVGFKLLSNASTAELIDTAYKHGIKNHSNLTVANTIKKGNFNDRTTVIITPEKGLIPVATADIAKRLVEVVSQRLSKNYYETNLGVDQSFDKNMSLEGEISDFKTGVEKLKRLNLFEPYYNGADAQFGFLAMRVKDEGKDKGFLITARGSNKENLALDDLAYVIGVDSDKRVIDVASSGKKASLNANTAARIFKERPDINLILHSHIYPGLKNLALNDCAAGTKEDEMEVAKYLSHGEKAVELPLHGIIAGGKDLDDLISTLEVEPAYKNFPEFYDLIYKRFQQGTDFLELVAKEVKKDESVLDLAAGTGDLTMRLLETGYKRIALADKSPEMLDVARKKLGRQIAGKNYYIADMKAVQLTDKFDAILVRQAMNYMMGSAELVEGLKNIYAHLKPGGRLIFNAPSFEGMEGFSRRDLKYETDGYHVKVKEMNLQDGKTMIHTQNCTLIKNDGSEIKKLYDINRFGIFSKQDFEEALKQAGFGKIRFLGKGLEEYSPGSKTIYCVAAR